MRRGRILLLPVAGAAILVPLTAAGGHAAPPASPALPLPAACGLDATDIAVFGSPGLTARSVTALHTRACVWAGRGAGDWMRLVPKVRFLGVGFGADPATAAFGARRFAAGGGGHSDYLRPGGVALHNLALIALGRNGEVSRARCPTPRSGHREPAGRPPARRRRAAATTDDSPTWVDRRRDGPGRHLRGADRRGHAGGPGSGDG